MNKFDEMRQAMSEAEHQLKAADSVAERMARMLVGRLRKIDNGYILAQLKKELRAFAEEDYMNTTPIDLVTDSGELIRIEVPTEHEDECWDAINNGMKRGDWWSPNMFDGCRAEYLGMPLDRVNMNKVVRVAL